MFKDQESNVNKPFHLLPTRKLSISNGEVAMLAGLSRSYSTLLQDSFVTKTLFTWSGGPRSSG